MIQYYVFSLWTKQRFYSKIIQITKANYIPRLDVTNSNVRNHSQDAYVEVLCKDGIKDLNKMTEKKKTSSPNASQDACVEVLCNDGNKDLNKMTEKKKTSSSNDSH